VELLENLRDALEEALERNRADARAAAGGEFEEVSISETLAAGAAFDRAILASSDKLAGLAREALQEHTCWADSRT
jgi:hypothetical protein